MTRSTQCSAGFLSLAGLAAALALAAGPATAAITWNVAGGGAWDTTTPNWTGDSTTFTDNGTVDVLFNNTAGGTITIAANMSPASTTVSASSGTYTFTGGPIDSGTLMKSGGGTLTLTGANTYSGGTSITGGSITLGNKNGFGTGTVTLAGGVHFKTSGFEGNSADGALPNDFILSGGNVNVDVSFGAKDIWINTSVSGPGGFNVTGSNQRNPGLMLSGAKTFEGGVRLGSGGRVTVDHVGSLGTGTLRGENGTLRIAANLPAGVPNHVVVAQGANFNVLVDNGRSATLSGIISDEGTGGNLVKNDPGTLTLTGTNTYRGATTINAGTLNLGGDGRLGSGTYAGNIAIAGGASLTYSSSATQNLTGTISGGGSLTMSGTGTLYLNPGGANIGATPNAFTGGATLSAGMLRVNSAANNGLGTGPFTLSGGTIGVGGNNIHTLNNAAYYIDGSFSAVNNGGHTLRFSTGDVTLGATPTVTVGPNFTLEIYGTIGEGGNTFGLTKDGAGTLRLSSQNSTYTGKTVVLSGTLNAHVLKDAGIASSLGAPTGTNAVIDMHNGTTLRTAWFSQTNSTTDRVINLAGAGPGTVTLLLENNDTRLTLDSPITASGTGAKTLALRVHGDRPGMILNGAIPDVADGSPLSLHVTVGGNDQSAGLNRGILLNAVNTFTGPLSLTAGAGRLTIGGTGQLGGGNYANTIALNGGELHFASSAAQVLSGEIAGTGKLTMNGADTLTLSGENTFTGATAINNGTLRLTGSILATSDLSFGNSGLLDLDNTGLINVLQTNYTTDDAFADILGGRIVGGNTLLATTFDDGGMLFTQITVVPEPGAGALLGMGLIGLLALRRRRR